jgi:hypothetical protein
VVVVVCHDPPEESDEDVPLAARNRPVRVITVE